MKAVEEGFEVVWSLVVVDRKVPRFEGFYRRRMG
jgi:hypothetical protein